MDPERTCLELALEGEQHCKAGDCRKGVYFFEAAIQSGTSNLRTLSAIYSQLGNAYFYLQDYEKALEYHKHDLNLAKTIGDRLGEAKANGNIGNTLKVLGEFDSALFYCDQHLKISSQLKDKIGEARALYNLGNVYLAKAKSVTISDDQGPGQYPASAEQCLLQAVDNYIKNLSLVCELNDKAAQGRVFGNLGNTYYLLGDFDKAVHYHQQRLAVAKEFGDKAAERRAYTNLGNAFIFQGQFMVAAQHYKNALQICRQLGERTLEAQTCYSLGNSYTLLEDYPQAIYYYLQHLRIAQELNDTVGEARACWSLGNAHTAAGQPQEGVEYAVRYRDISAQIGDPEGLALAEQNLADLLKVHNSSAVSRVPTDNSDVTDAGLTRNYRSQLSDLADVNSVKLLSKPVTAGDDPDPVISGGVTPVSKPPLTGGSKVKDDADLFDLICRSQSRRIDDQRCSLRQKNDPVVKPLNVDENKTALPPASSTTTSDKQLDERFFDMLIRSQGCRLEDQRSSLRRPAAPTVPDDDFFNLIQRLQSNRLETQRSAIKQPATSVKTVLQPLPLSVASTPNQSERTSQLPPSASASDKKKRNDTKKK